MTESELCSQLKPLHLKFLSAVDDLGMFECWIDGAVINGSKSQ